MYTLVMLALGPYQFNFTQRSVSTRSERGGGGGGGCYHQLTDAYVRLFITVVCWNRRNVLDPFLNSIRDVRHDLHCSTEVFASSFPFEYNPRHKLVSARIYKGIGVANL